METIQYFSLGGRRVPDSRLTSRELRALRIVNSRVAARESLDAVMNSLFECILKVNPKCDRLGLSLLVENSRRATAHWTRTEYQPAFLKTAQEGLYSFIKAGLTRVRSRVHGRSSRSSYRSRW